MIRSVSHGNLCFYIALTHATLDIYKKAGPAPDREIPAKTAKRKKGSSGHPTFSTNCASLSVFLLL